MEQVKKSFKKRTRVKVYGFYYLNVLHHATLIGDFHLLRAIDEYFFMDTVSYPKFT